MWWRRCRLRRTLESLAAERESDLALIGALSVRIDALLGQLAVERERAEALSKAFPLLFLLLPLRHNQWGGGIPAVT